MAMGEKLSDLDHSKKFRELYLNLNQDESMEKFFYLNKKVNLQFDGFIMLLEELSISQETIARPPFKDFIYYCMTFSFFLNMIVEILNKPYKITDQYFRFAEFNNLDENFDQKALELFFKEDANFMKNSLINLKNTFNNLDLVKRLLNTNRDTDEIKINLQALFFIIKQILYQFILEGSIKSVSTNENIIKITKNKTFEGKFFQITYQPDNMLNMDMNPFNIINLDLEDKKELCFVKEVTGSFSQEKGIIFKLKVEKLIETGFNIKSNSNQIINMHLQGEL